MTTAEFNGDFWTALQAFYPRIAAEFSGPLGPELIRSWRQALAKVPCATAVDVLRGMYQGELSSRIPYNGTFLSLLREHCHSRRDKEKGPHRSQPPKCSICRSAGLVTIVSPPMLVVLLELMTAKSVERVTDIVPGSITAWWLNHENNIHRTTSTWTVQCPCQEPNPKWVRMVPDRDEPVHANQIAAAVERRYKYLIERGEV